MESKLVWTWIRLVFYFFRKGSKNWSTVLRWDAIIAIKFCFSKRVEIAKLVLWRLMGQTSRRKNKCKIHAYIYIHTYDTARSSLYLSYAGDILMSCLGFLCVCCLFEKQIQHESWYSKNWGALGYTEHIHNTNWELQTPRSRSLSSTDYPICFA